MALIRKLKHAFWSVRLWRCPVPNGFDGDWYLDRYPDVAGSGMPAWLHYVRFGRRERRDPNPNFSTTGYLHEQPRARRHPDALLHYERQPEWDRGAPRPVLAGQQPYAEGAMTLMVVGHQAGKELFGAERSLLEVLTLLNSLNINLVVVLPGAENSGYLDAVRELAWQVAIVPYGWWRRDRAPVAATLGHFRERMRHWAVDAVLVNTLVLHEPLLAARNEGLPVAVHVRELLAHDEALREALGGDERTLLEWLARQADVLVANSRFTARQLPADNVLVVPNVLEMAELEPVPGPAERGEPVTVGMISSNLPKKGLDDFVAMARVLESLAPGVRCRLIGPENPFVRALRERFEREGAPANLVLAGYSASSQVALAELDIVVNLSHFQESFGRTVLEAMAVGKPVVAYHWGALPELVVDGETGYLIPLGEVEEVAKAVRQLSEAPAERARMGEAGARRARENYGPEAARQSLQQMLERLESCRQGNRSQA